MFHGGREAFSRADTIYPSEVPVQLLPHAYSLDVS